MMLGDAELSRRFSMQDEAEQRAKIDREQANELEYVDESQKEDSTATASGSSGNTGGKPVRNPEREKPKWEDTITIVPDTSISIFHDVSGSSIPFSFAILSISA